MTLFQTKHFMAATCLCASMVGLPAGPALASSDVNASDGMVTNFLSTYRGYLAGVEFSKIAIGGAFHAQGFQITGNGRASGMVRIFAKARGSFTATGSVRNGKLQTSRLKAHIRTKKRNDIIDLGFAGANLKTINIKPAPKHKPDRIKLTASHLKNVIGPVTGMFLHHPEGLTRNLCSKTIPVHIGRQRFNIALHFKRFRTIKTSKGYRGKVAVCSVKYHPIAGHRPTKKANLWLTKQANFHVWLAPLTGNQYFAPWRITARTALGDLNIQAQKFYSNRTAHKTAQN